MVNDTNRRCVACRGYAQRAAAGRKINADGFCSDCQPASDDHAIPKLDEDEIAREWNLSVKMVDSLVSAFRASPEWIGAHAAQAGSLRDRGLVDIRAATGNLYSIRLIEHSDGYAVAAAIERCRRASR